MGKKRLEEIDNQHIITRNDEKPIKPKRIGDNSQQGNKI